MSNRTRDILTIFMVVFLALLSFGGGYFVRDLAGSRAGLLGSGDDQFSVFWEAWDRIEGSYLGQLPSSQQMTYGAVRGSISVLNDPYTVFVEPAAREVERDQLRGNFGGIGASIRQDEEGNFRLAPIEGNPAEAAGILEGDILLAVDDHEITSELTVEGVVQLIRGEVGEAVNLRVLHEGETEPVTIAIIRAAILLPFVSYRILDEDPSIGYIRLVRFSAESKNEVSEAIVTLQELGAQRLILDLRQNVGGLRDAAVEVSDHFLDQGPVLYQLGKDESERVFSSTGETLAGDVPLAVLVDGGTASSAEILAGALQDRGRAVLIGMNTFGKGSVQNVYDLSDGSSIHVTAARWLTPDRKAIDQQGLTPDIIVLPTQEGIDNGLDEALQRAIQYLQS
jgi:carboxyl-terminal processing protease